MIYLSKSENDHFAVALYVRVFRTAVGPAVIYCVKGDAVIAAPRANDVRLTASAFDLIFGRCDFRNTG